MKAMTMNAQTHQPIAARPRRQRGASMIEVLVSILIFAFGMLGLVGLQTRTLAYGQVSMYRSQATALADDIIDRMRADRVNAKAGNWNSAITEKYADITGTALAKTELKDWKNQLENLLPDGKASVAWDATTGLVTVDIRWFERGNEQQTGADQSHWISKSAL
jgi:type IV pilus assembly protein PilV